MDDGETQMPESAPDQKSSGSRRRRLLNFVKRREAPSLHGKPTARPRGADALTPPASPPRTHVATTASPPATAAAAAQHPPAQHTPATAALAIARAPAPAPPAARSPTSPRSSTASWTWTAPSPRHQPPPNSILHHYARSTASTGGGAGSPPPSRLASPASSLIFERSVADAPAGADDRIPAALEAGSRAVVDAGVGVGDVRVVTSALLHGESEVEDEDEDGRRRRRMTTGGESPAEYANLEGDPTRLSFVSFADVVEAEAVEQRLRALHQAAGPAVGAAPSPPPSATAVAVTR
jgi:hypothetical protein